MFRRQRADSPGQQPRTIDLVEETAERDPDPVVQAAAERLREQLSSLQAIDEWGRPVTLRQVARIALGPLASPRVRDALTIDLLSESVAQEEPQRSVSPDASGPSAEWRALFRSLDDRDRLLEGHPGITAGPGPN